MMRTSSFIIVLVLSLHLAGCDGDDSEDLLDELGERCEETCDRIYGSEEGQCFIERPGTTTDMLTEACVERCEEAVEEEEGGMGDYDPNERTSPSMSFELQNRTQAVAWMDCVEQTSCENLTNGYCAPIY